MDALSELLKYAIVVIGVVLAGLAAVLLAFGNRIRKQWEFDAEFRDAEGREFGEFEIESSAVGRGEAEFTVKARFSMRHPALVLYKRVQVLVEDTIVLEGRVSSPGQIALGPEDGRGLPDTVQAGQRCRVAIEGSELFAADLVPD